MLPLAIDRALVVPQADVFMVLTLFACGALLRQSMDRSPLVLQMFCVGTTVSMTIWLGLFFTSTELRLYNASSMENQVEMGRGVAVLGATIGLLWLGRIFLKPAT